MPVLMVILVILSTVAVPPAGAAQRAALQSDGGLPVVANEFVSGEFLARAGGHDLGRAERRLTERWSLVVDRRPGSPEEVARRLSAELGVAVVPNRLVELAQADEPRFDEQWALENTGQTGGLAGADIDAPAAWAHTVGSEAVIVAVVDSGIDLDHPDLVDQLWVNPNEIAGNGIDDDANGLVDDVHGWDFVSNDAEPEDTVGHGSAVAGIIGSAANGVGVAGVAPGVLVMPVQACSTICPMSALVAAVDYAVAQGADVVNLSLGGYGSGFEPLADAIEGAGLVGVLVVAAAGNDGADNDTTPYLPASLDFDNVLAVAATDHQDELAAFSNFGTESVDLAAPGVEVLAPTIDDWATVSGTSYAAPHAAGVAALMLSIDPLSDAPRLRALITEAAAPLAGLAGTSESGGRLDAANAVRAAGGPAAALAWTASSSTAPATVVLDATGSYDPTGSTLAYAWTVDGRSLEGDSVLEVEFADHLPHAIEVSVTDADGLQDTATSIVDLNGAPEAAIDPAGFLAVAPAVIPFSAVVSDPDGDPVAVTWELNGSAVGATTEILVEQAMPGAYRLVLRAGDGIAEATAEVSVLVGEDYTDTRNSIFRLDVAWLSAKSLTAGCGPDRFCPDRTISRGEAAAFLRRFLDLGPGTDAFSDDDATQFEDDIDSIAAAMITAGCRPGAFCPERLITRGEWAAMLVRALGLEAAGVQRFTDLAGSPFEHEIEALREAGITRGCNPPTNDRFCPTAELSRAEVAAMLHRADAEIE